MADYTLLAEAGALGDARTELIEGDAIVRSPQLLPHGLAKADLHEAPIDAIRKLRWSLRVLSDVSVDLSPDSMPMPDPLLAAATLPELVVCTTEL